VSRRRLRLPQWGTGPAGPRDSGVLVGLAFIGLVLVLLFCGGALGVLVTKGSATSPTAPLASAPPSSGPGDPARRALHDAVVQRFRQMMQVRQVALLRRDAGLLGAIYTPNSPNLRRDRHEIDALLQGHKRWVDLTLPVGVLHAYQVSSGRWMVIAVLGRSSARLVTDDGQLLRDVPSAEAVYWCTLLRVQGAAGSAMRLYQMLGAT
jgi:hypothetical protein